MSSLYIYPAIAMSYWIVSQDHACNLSWYRKILCCVYCCKQEYLSTLAYWHHSQFRISYKPLHSFLLAILLNIKTWHTFLLDHYSTYSAPRVIFFLIFILMQFIYLSRNIYNYLSFEVCCLLQSPKLNFSSNWLSFGPNKYQSGFCDLMCTH